MGTFIQKHSLSLYMALDLSYIWSYLIFLAYIGENGEKNTKHVSHDGGGRVKLKFGPDLTWMKLNFRILLVSIPVNPAMG